MITKVLISLLIVVTVGLKGLAIYSGNKRPKLKLIDGKLAVCPLKSLKCVSTTNETDQHQVAPIDTNKDLNEIISIIETELGGIAIGFDQDYVHFQVKTPLIGYVDDLEIQLRGGTLYIRSESRVGRSDLGANRKRVERLREIL